MKSIKLVATGTAILMCIILVNIKTNTGAIKQVMQETPVELQTIMPQQSEEQDNLLIYPSCLPAVLRYQ